MGVENAGYVWSVTRPAADQVAANVEHVCGLIICGWLGHGGNRRFSRLPEGLIANVLVGGGHAFARTGELARGRDVRGLDLSVGGAPGSVVSGCRDLSWWLHG